MDKERDEAVLVEGHALGEGLEDEDKADHPYSDDG